MGCEIMTAKEYLSGAWQIKLRIENMTEIAEFMRSVAESTSANISHTPKPATRNIHKTEDAIIKLIDFEQRIEVEREKLNEVLSVIDNIKDPIAQKVTVKRYIERKSWNAIASEIFASEKTVRNIHATMLREVEKVIKNSP